MQILALWLDGYNDLYTRAAGTNDCRPFATEVVAFFGACIIHELSLWTYQHQSIRPSTALENTASADEEVGIVLKKNKRHVFSNSEFDIPTTLQHHSTQQCSAQC